MSKTTNVENTQISGITWVADGKTLELTVTKAGGMDINKVKENTLPMPDVAYHTCEYDKEKNISRRRYEGKTVDVADEILAQALAERKKSKRPVKEVSEISGELGTYTILDLKTGETENGTIEIER